MMTESEEDEEELDDDEDSDEIEWDIDILIPQEKRSEIVEQLMHRADYQNLQQKYLFKMEQILRNDYYSYKTKNDFAIFDGRSTQKYFRKNRY